MDVSEWTAEQRIRFPDYCFGSRQLIGSYTYNNIPDSDVFGISDIPLPDKMCLWELTYLMILGINDDGWARAGLAESIPTSEAEMDAAVEIYPHFGITRDGPNILPKVSYQWSYAMVPFRKAFETGGKYLVAQNHCVAGTCRVQIGMLVSGLPTSMAGWLAHHKV